MMVRLLIIMVFQLGIGQVFADDVMLRNYLFDMGGIGSSVAEGFIRITEDSEYANDTGYGWIQAPQSSFDVPDVKPSTPLTRDGVLAASEVVFRIDAPSGDYFLTVTLGGGPVSNLAMDVKVSGEPIGAHVETPWHRLPFRTLRRRITHAGGPVLITIQSDSTDVGVHGIELRPVTPIPSIAFTSALDADTADVAAAARHLHERLTDHPADIGIINRLDLLEKYLLACYYFDIGWWSWAVEQTGMSIFNRYWYASDLLRQILADERDPLYDRAAYLLGKIHYWLYQEQHLDENIRDAEHFFRMALRNHPEHRLVRMYLGEKFPYGTACPSSNGNAPRWATAQREAMCRVLEIIHWWVDNRQVANGELGGKFGDDVEMLRWWLPAILGADDPKARLGFKRLAEGVWHSGELVRGFAKEIADVEHSAEFITDTQPAMMLMEYGNPVYVERCLISMQNFRDVWTGVNSRGHRHFKSSYLSAQAIIEDPPYAVDVAMNARATVPGLWVAWYNQNPTILRLFSEWGRAWVEDAVRTDKGKPRGVLPAAVRYDNDALGGYSENWYHPNLGWHYYRWEMLGGVTEMYNQLVGMYDLTGDASFLEPLHLTLDLAMREVPFTEAAPMGSEAWVRQVLRQDTTYILSYPVNFHLLVGRAKVLAETSAFDDYLDAYGTPYLRYLMTGDASFLVDGCEAIIHEVDHNFELKTSEAKFTDRVYVPGAHHLFSMYTGGIGRGKEFPSMAVTWENTGSDVAVLVHRAGKTELEVELYNYGAGKEVGMRAWRLEPGVYRVRTGADSDGDGNIDGREDRRTFRVEERGQRLALWIPPEEVTRIAFEQKKTFTYTNAFLPDAALSGADVRIDETDASSLIVTVHNIGSAPLEEVRVSLFIDEHPAGVQILETIEAPVDLVPRYQDVRFKMNVEKGAHSVRVALAFGGREITRTNNHWSGEIHF